MKFIHIGLGKTGTTFLQNELFPKIAQTTNLKYFRSKDLINIDRMKENFFLSSEHLAAKEYHCNSSLWKNSSKINYENFGPESNIIITIRHPIDYMTSCICEAYRNNIILDEKNFFLNNEDSEMEILKKNYFFFNYENFKLEKIISYYRKFFKKVYVIKYEDIKNLSVWSKVFDCEEIKYLKFKDYYRNKSYSNLAMKLTLLLEKFLNFFNYDLKSYYEFITQIPKSKYLPNKIKNRLCWELRWNYFIQFRFDKFIKYKKYQLNYKLAKEKANLNNDKFYNLFTSRCYDYSFKDNFFELK